MKREQLRAELTANEEFIQFNRQSFHEGNISVTQLILNAIDFGKQQEEISKLKESHNELLEAANKTSVLLDFVINATESGTNRNYLTDANIFIKTAINNAIK